MGHLSDFHHHRLEKDTAAIDRTDTAPETEGVPRDQSGEERGPVELVTAGEEGRR